MATSQDVVIETDDSCKPRQAVPRQRPILWRGVANVCGAVKGNSANGDVIERLTLVADGRRRRHGG